MHADELKGIPEQPTACINPTVHPGNLYMSTVTLCTVQTHIGVPQLCPMATSAKAKLLRTIPIVKTLLKRTCSTQRSGSPLGIPARALGIDNASGRRLQWL